MNISYEEVTALRSLLRSAQKECKRTGRWAYYTPEGWAGQRLHALLGRATQSESESSPSTPRPEAPNQAIEMTLNRALGLVLAAAETERDRIFLQLTKFEESYAAAKAVVTGYYLALGYAELVAETTHELKEMELALGLTRDLVAPWLKTSDNG